MAVEFLDAEPTTGVTFLDEQPATSGGVEFLDEQSPSESSVIGAAGREVVRETLPTVAGFKGGAWGAARGALWGSRLGPYGALGGGIIGGIAGFIGASAGASKLQELGIKAVVSDETYQGFEKQIQADVEQHPWAVTAGSLVPWALHPLGRPNPAALGRAVEFVKGARAAKVAGTGIADYIKTEQGLANLPDFQRVAFGAGTQAAFGAWDSMKQGKFDAVDFGMRVMAGAILTGPSPIRAVVAKEPGGPEVLAGLAEEAAKTPDIPIPEKAVPAVPKPPRIASEDATGARVATPPPPIVPSPIVQTPVAAVEVPVERPPVAEPVAAPAEAPAPAAEARAPKETVLLPKELAGAKPRYSYGSKQFELTFDSDVDKAAYITAQKTKSKRDADYLKFAMKNTDMDEAAVRDYGAQVRQRIKAQAKDAEPGTLTVPASETMRQGIPAAAKPPELTGIRIQPDGIDAKRVPDGLRTPLSTLIDAPELFAKYPDFKNISVVFEKGKVGYASREFTKGVDAAPIIRIDAELRSDPVMVVRALVHELTHEVQVREGRPVGPEIAKGLSLEEADRLYRDHPSEQEARRNAEAVSPAPVAKPIAEGATYMGIQERPGQPSVEEWRANESGSNFNVPVGTPPETVSAEASRVDAKFKPAPAAKPPEMMGEKGINVENIDAGIRGRTSYEGRMSPEYQSRIEQISDSVEKVYGIRPKTIKQKYLRNRLGEWDEQSKTLSLERDVTDNTIWHEHGHMVWAEMLRSDAAERFVIDHAFNGKAEQFKDAVAKYRKQFPLSKHLSDARLVDVHSQQASRAEEQFAANFMNGHERSMAGKGYGKGVNGKLGLASVPSSVVPSGHGIESTHRTGSGGGRDQATVEGNTEPRRKRQEAATGIQSVTSGTESSLRPASETVRRPSEALTQPPSPAPAATEPVKATTPEPPAAVEPRKRGVLSDETRAKNPVAAIIEDNGGVRPYKQAKGQKPAGPKEHYTSIPLRYRAKKGGGGLPADEMLSIVQADHPSIQTVEDMIATLKGKKRLVSEETYYTDQAEGEADWIANRSETVKPDVLGVGDSMKIKGETFRVTEETDSAIRLKDGAEYWLPYESDETLRIDKGSLKHGEPPVPVPPGKNATVEQRVVYDGVPYEKRSDGKWYSRGTPTPVESEGLIGKLDKLLEKKQSPVPPGKKVVAENLVKAGVVQRASEVAKEPWQIRLSEYKKQPVYSDEFGEKVIPSESVAIARHKQAVDEAMKTGKPVPKEVLADYPKYLKSPGLTLEAATPEQLKAEAFARAAKAKMAEKAAAPLAAKAAQEDLATGDMFERTSLFQPPVAETPERAATLKAENAKRQATMFDDLEKRGKEGLDRLNKEGRVTTGADPERFFYLAEIGAAKIGRGVNNFARWSAEMVKEFGEWVREHLPQIWKQAQALHAEKTKPALPSEEHTVAEIQEAGRVQVERDAGLGGVDRDSVAPPSEPKPTLPPVSSYSAGGQQFRKALDANEATVRNFFGFSWTKARDFMAAAFLDVHRPITRRLEGMGPAGKRIIAMFDRMAGSSPKASLEIQDAIDSVMATLPKTPESGRRLDGIRLAKRVIEATELQAKRGETRTWPKGMSPESARAFLADEAKLLGPEKFKQYEDAAQTVSTAMENQIVKLRDAGLLTPEDAKYILDNHKSYMPLEFLTKIDPDATSFSVLGKKVTVPDSGLQRLGAGDEGALISNWRYLLSQVVQRTDKRIAKNNLNRALYDAAKPGNALGVVTDETLKQKAIALLQQGEMELGAPIEKLVRAYDTLPNGVKVGNVTQTAGENMQPIDVVVDGMTRRMWMHQDLVKYWTPPSHAEISDRVMRIMGWLSGATPVRALATGYNPEFAWRNLFMDAGYNWFRTNEYSTFLPQAFGQRISDLRAVAKDAWNFGPETRAFINEGGSLDFLTQQGSLMRAEYEHPGPHHEFAEKAQRVLSKLNNTSEMMGRLATRRRAILNGSTPAEATLIARNVLDFHKGGFVTKTLDRIGMPYLNAGFRAADGMAQAAVGNPREFAMKVGQLAVFASGLTYWAFRTSPKTMDSIPDREREGFWIIPLGDLSVMDATGKPRYLYMKFRKDQAARAMAAAAETTTERMMGRKVDGNRIWMGLADFMPTDPMSLDVPVHAAYISYALNKDLWNKEDAWKGAKVSPEQEYTERTPQGYVLASKTLASLGIPASPERIKTAGQRVFPLNGWTALMGGAASWLLPDDKAVRQSFAEELMSAPGIRTVIGETRDYDLSSERLAAAKRYGIPLVNPDGTPRPSTRIADEIDAAQITINDRRQVLNRTLDNLMARTKTGQETFDSLNAWIQTIPDAAEQKRLHERVKSKLAGYMARVNP